MANKTKTKNTVLEKLGETAMQAGIVMMAAAVTLGLVEMPKDETKRQAIVPLRPVFEIANNSNDLQDSNPLRREREEAGPHYISYGVSQRTPGRSGKIK